MDKIQLETRNFLELKLLDGLRPIVLIAPGGGYHYTSSREADPVAKVFQKAGFHSGIIYYRETKLLYPDTVKELSEFVREIRIHSGDLNIKTDGIYLLGFSAGGHYVASLGVDWEKYGKATRPDALILAYPVITGKKGFSHEGSIQNLFGEISAEVRADFSLEYRVNASTPPTFLFHTVTDQAVSYQNSLLFFEALSKNNVKTEIHLFQEGPHGLSLANRETAYENEDPLEFERKYRRISIWPDLAASFLFEIEKSDH
jgi:acetyl esterase/lipase